MQSHDATAFNALLDKKQLNALTLAPGDLTAAACTFAAPTGATRPPARERRSPRWHHRRPVPWHRTSAGGWAEREQGRLAFCRKAWQTVNSFRLRKPASVYPAPDRLPAALESSFSC